MVTSKVTFQGSYRRCDLTNATGYVTIEPVSPRNVNNNVVVQDTKRTYPLVNGSFVATMVYSVQGYQVQEVIEGITFPAQVLTPSPGDTVDFGLVNKTSIPVLNLTGTFHDTDDAPSSGEVQVRLVDQRQVIAGYVFVRTVLHMPLVNGEVGSVLAQTTNGYSVTEVITGAATQETLFYPGDADINLGGSAVAIPPAAPTGLTATALSSSSVSLIWTASPGATAYTIERSLNGTTGWTSIGSSATTNFSNPGLSAGTSYYYRVIASNNLGSSTPSATASVLTYPPAPTGLIALANGQTRVDLTWSAALSATSYVIERSQDGVTNWTQVGTSTGTTFSNTGLTVGTTYYYRVSAVNQSGSSTPSNVANATTVIGAPTSPTGLAAVAANSTEIDLTWNSSAGATSYGLQRAPDVAGSPGTWATIASNVTALSYQDTGLTASTKYHYRVRAQNVGGNSGYTLPVNATTPGVSGTAAPQNVTGVFANGAVFLTWQPPSSGVVTSYIIRRSGQADILMAPQNNNVGWQKTVVDGLNVAEFDAVLGSADIAWGGNSTTRAAATYTFSVLATTAGGSSNPVSVTGTVETKDPLFTRNGAGDLICGHECFGPLTVFNTAGDPDFVPGDGFYPGRASGQKRTFVGMDFSGYSVAPVNVEFIGCKFRPKEGEFANDNGYFNVRSDRLGVVNATARYCTFDGRHGGWFPTMLGDRSNFGAVDTTLGCANYCIRVTDSVSGSPAIVTLKGCRASYSAHTINIDLSNPSSKFEVLYCGLNLSVMMRDPSDSSKTSHTSHMHLNPRGMNITLRGNSSQMDNGPTGQFEEENGGNINMLCDHCWFDGSQVQVTGPHTNVTFIHNRYKRPIFVASLTALGGTDYTIPVLHPLAPDVPDTGLIIVGSEPGPTVTAAFIKDSNVMTVAGANFTNDDVGKYIYDFSESLSTKGDGLWYTWPGVQITQVDGPTQVRMSHVALNTGSIPVKIGYQWSPVTYGDIAEDRMSFLLCNGGQGTTDPAGGTLFGGKIIHPGAQSCGSSDNIFLNATNITEDDNVWADDLLTSAS